MLNDDFNIDSLKKSWQEQSVSEIYKTPEIEAMLNKTSKNYVKYIFWISLAEFLFFAILSVYTVFSAPENNSFMHILEKLGVKINSEIEKNYEHMYFGLKIISLLITAVFVYLFYRNYKKINVENNLKKFILQIIKFKKTVNLFILTNIFFLVIFIFILTLFTLNTLKTQNIYVNNPTLLGVMVGIFVSLIFGVSLILLYYRIVYGIIMKRLSKNLEQLQKIEKSE